MPTWSTEALITSLDEIPARYRSTTLVRPVPVVRPPVARDPVLRPSPPVRRHTPRPLEPNDHPVLAPWLRQAYGRSMWLSMSLDLSPSNITMWARGKRQIPVRRCYQIESLTQGLLTCELLRPDLPWARWHYTTRVRHVPTGYHPPPHPRVLKRILARLL